MTGSPDRSISEITTVLLCSDMLATRESEQLSNLRWFADLMSRPIGEALPDATVQVGLEASFDRGAVLKQSVEGSALKRRHCWFDPEALDEEALAILRQAVGPQTLVVGYEMSWMTRSALTAGGIPWVDVWLHPVRFADDIFFAVRASEGRVNERMAEFAVSSESLRAQADVLKVQNYRGFTKFEPDIADGSALFIGQTANDKSVLHQNGFLDILDFEEEFRELARSHPHVYFSRHPHQPHLPKAIRAFIDGFENVSEITAPTYHLLADARITSVASVSSSVLEEARYFGKRTHRFHPPPFPLEGADRYETILHALCFPHFWATILRDMAAVAETRPAGFIDPRNKLRHALSFTWGYRDIDKYERMTAEPVVLGTDMRPALTVETAELVTFDVFDTLLSRRVASPRDVFEILAKDAVAITGGDLSEFVERRMAAERLATMEATGLGREDPTLLEIYSALLNCAEDDGRVRELCSLEISTEAKVIVARSAGAALYRRARRAGRRIALISDTYLPRAALEDYLKASGYDDWDDLFVSSETGCTKRTGSLFELVLSSTGIAPHHVLHVGDNPRGDVAIPNGLGIVTRHLPLALDNMRAAAPFLRSAIARMSNAGMVGGSAFLAQIASRFYDDEAAARLSDGFGRDAEKLGYVVLGPLLTGFAGWLHGKAVEHGIDRLGFLTREGLILRAAYEALYPGEHLDTRTVIASRRIVQHISLTSGDEIEKAAIRFGSAYKGSVADFLATHFGLPGSQIDLSAVTAAGLSSAHAPIPSKIPAEVLRKIVLSHKDEISRNAMEARQNLVQYLRESGLTEGRSGLVDIGYAGQVQGAYSRVADVEMAGFYLATFRRSRDVLRNLPAFAFIADQAAANDGRYGICRHRKIYETLLCASGPTLVGVSRKGDGWEGTPGQTGHTPVRDAFVHDAHKGALLFVKEYAASGMSAESLSPVAATSLIDAMLDNPTTGLAEWLGRLEFDDSFAIDQVSTLIDPARSPSRSVWSEGARMVSRTKKQSRPRVKRRSWQAFGPYGILGWRHALSPVVAPIIARIGDAKDADHFRDDPIGFFRRLSDPRFRRIGRILYPWD